MITSWLSSYRTYCLSVAFAHFLLFTFFFPAFVFYTIVLVMMFTVMYVWCDLMHSIEEAHRMDILNLLHTCEIPETRNLLAYELYLHDENSLAGHRPFHLDGM